MTATLYTAPYAQGTEPASAIRRYSEYLRERQGRDWRRRSECRRLRVGANLRRLSLQQALTCLRSRDDLCEEVEQALAQLDAELRSCAISGTHPVEARSAQAVEEAVSTLVDALEKLLRPVGVSGDDACM